VAGRGARRSRAVGVAVAERERRAGTREREEDGEAERAPQDARASGGTAAASPAFVGGGEGPNRPNVPPRPLRSGYDVCRVSISSSACA
jgi:hypothetical protein